MTKRYKVRCRDRTDNRIHTVFGYGQDERTGTLNAIHKLKRLLGIRIIEVLSTTETRFKPYV